MKKLARVFRISAAAMIVAGLVGGLAVHFSEVLAQEPRNETLIQKPDPWIGKTVVTKYGVPVPGVKSEPGIDRIFRVYTVQEQQGIA